MTEVSMFDVRLMVEVSKLGKVMAALDGLLAEKPTIIPVRGAVVKRSSTGPTVKAHPRTADGSIRSRFTERLITLGGQAVGWAQLNDIMREAGGTKGSVGATITSLIKQGLLERTEKRGQYLVSIVQR